MLCSFILSNHIGMKNMIPDISRKQVSLKKSNIFRGIKFALQKAEKMRRLKQFCKVGQHFAGLNLIRYGLQSAALQTVVRNPPTIKN